MLGHEDPDPVTHCEAAVERTANADIDGAESTLVMQELAQAYASAGQRDAAVETARRALEGASSDDQRKEATELLDRLSR